jgi:hypothetical protein
MGWLVAIIVLPLLFVIGATYAVLRFAMLLIQLCFLPVTVLLALIGKLR